MNIQLLRHATVTINFAGFNILVDPMLSSSRTSEPIANTANQQRNPLVDLPFNENYLVKVLQSIDAVIVTHLHNDHWDQQARDLLPKSLPIFCQPDDQLRIEDAGFLAVQPVSKSVDWNGLQVVRTEGQHGRGKIGELMAPVSGFVLKAAGEPLMYIAGDTVWCDEVEQALELHQPEIIVVNAGAAQFTSGGPITMDADDVINVATAAPEATVIAVHMEAINHCLLSREELRKATEAAAIASRVNIPQDGESVTI